MPDVLPLDTARPDYPSDPLPSWVTELRGPQVDAVREAAEAFDEGADVVFMDAPVGAGKTLIGELARREVNVAKGLYVCTDKALQDQFLGDYPYAKVLKGRANYIPTHPLGDVTCEDCTSQGPGSSCNWCDETWACPYVEAKKQALGSRTNSGWSGGARVAVLNTAYFLVAANHARSMRKYDLVVADECDLLEGALIGFVEYEVPEWIGRRLGLTYPKKGVHKPTLIKWLLDVVETALLHEVKDLEVKRQNRFMSWIKATTTVAHNLQQDVDAAKRHEDDDSDADQSGRWIRDYGDDRRPVRTLKLRPVMVSQFGTRNLWRHGKKWLLMSGTIISPEEMADSLGLPLEYRTVVVPSSFPVENRPIILAPVANVTYRATGADYDALVSAIEAICAKHQGRVLVHTVSYKLTSMLHDRCALGGRRKVQYTSGAGKNAALAEYLRFPETVLFAPSMDRGVDLKGDKCAVQIIAKCPFPSLQDTQVSARMHLPGGQQWYSVRTIRDIVQMTGRGVRSETDKCTTYILDQQFTRNVWGKNKQMFPAYFREAVRERDDIRWMLKGRRAA